jgi:glycosyltransferase involved in cell wall biosynthesis
MKICILADVQSAHTQRWVKAIAEAGHKVIVISFREGQVSGVKCHFLNTPDMFGISPSIPFWGRFHYLFSKNAAQSIVDEFDPDIVHAFWATSYGFLGARLKSKFFMVSVWGMDITDSPRNPIMRQIVKFTLKKARKIFCTSDYLMERTRPFVGDQGKLVHIPFGIDTDLFKPSQRVHDKTVVIGSTKSFEPKYGLMNLIKAFEILCQDYTHISLLLVGSGSLKQQAEQYVEENLKDKHVVFQEAVEVGKVPEFLNKMDIFVMPSTSNSETFGVAALEASACGLPVIASRIGGIPEVIRENVTGFLIEHDKVLLLAETIRGLIVDADKRSSMGQAGRQFVMERYLWQNNVADLISNYVESTVE